MTVYSAIDYDWDLVLKRIKNHSEKVSFRLITQKWGEFQKESIMWKISEVQKIWASFRKLQVSSKNGE